MARKVAGVTVPEYANRAVIRVAESAANTLTFQRLVTGVSLFERAAFLVHEIDRFISAAEYMKILNDADTITLGLTTAEIASIQPENGNLIWFQQYGLMDAGSTPATFTNTSAVERWSFADFPGGGLLIPATNIFGFVEGGSLASALTVSLQLWYSPLQLAPDEYWQLVESTRTLSAP